MNIIYLVRSKLQSGKIFTSPEGSKVLFAEIIVAEMVPEDFEWNRWEPGTRSHFYYIRPQPRPDAAGSQSCASVKPLSLSFLLL
jgi:hypothetical protein